MEILTRIKDVFDYNTDAARFIANNGTIDGRESVKRVEPVYIKLNEVNKEMGEIMKKH